MKIRTDFVTNSSSSSFVISKNNNAVTKDMVFAIIRDLYQKWWDGYNEFKNCSEDFGILIDKDCHIHFKNGTAFDEKNKAIRDTIRSVYNISIFDYFNVDIGWLSCQTYEEYEQYWINKCKEKISLAGEDGKKNPYVYGVFAPFSIQDFSSAEQHLRLECNLSYLLENDSENNYKMKTQVVGEDILSWYIPCASARFDCEEVYDCAYCDLKDTDRCENVCQYFKEKYSNENKNRVAFDLLGQFCIHSECGRIPNSIVENLVKMCDYSCNHMG